jgi:hypothetical protein
MVLIKVISFSLGALLVYGVLTVYARVTQEVIYSQDLPPNMVCVKDSLPKGYLCIPDTDEPWYLPKPEAPTTSQDRFPPD